MLIPNVSRLAELRKQLDQTDEELMNLLARRFRLCAEVAHDKIKTGTPMMQNSRVAQVKERAAAQAEAIGVSREFAINLYTLIIDEACRLEEEIISTHPR